VDKIFAETRKSQYFCTEFSFEMKNILLLIALIFPFFPVFPQAEKDFEVSLLTVAPRGKAVYTIFGHTALRLNNRTTGADIVLNWGTFDTDRPNFMYHFVRGETDYFLSAESYRDFSRRYSADGAAITEQPLNVPDSLKPLLIRQITTNLQPENVEYRYNYFFDNCTTRPRDLIEKFCGDEIIYPQQDEPVTLRNLVHEYTAPYPWLQFGIDLVIGSGADSLISKRTELFLPEKLSLALDGKSSTFQKHQKSLTPFFFCLALFALLFAVGKFRLTWAIFFFAAAVAGCLIAFLVCFSLHPCVSPNWNILWLHPLHLIGFASFIPKKKYCVFKWYHILNITVLSAFVIAWHWIPQEIDLACLPLIGSLWLGSFCWFKINCVLLHNKFSGISSMTRKRLVSILAITFFAAAKLTAQQKNEPPKLVISIVVDQLRDDYLHYFGSTFGERGFKRLMNEGLVYHRVDFGFPNLSASSSAATLSTGAYPYHHGITADKKYNFETLKEESVVADKNYLGNFTSDRFSPVALLASTVGDELKIASEGHSDVFAIAPDVNEALLSAGHYADAAFWLDDYNGKWATTTFYKNVPWYIDRYNSNRTNDFKEDLVWTPASGSYSGFPYSKATTPFRHTFSKNDGARYIRLKQSPFINTEITNLAETFFNYADFGKRAYPDLLAITYYAGNYMKGILPDEYSWEIQDIYQRLDKEIERLLDIAEKKVGLKNVLVVLTSTGYYDSVAGLPFGFESAGKFYPARCTALLNVYLMAIYGQGNWVQGYYREQIFLNKKLIEDKKIDLDEITWKSAGFLAQFSGVQEVTTAGQWFVDDVGRSANFRRGINRKSSGDLFIELQPGWEIEYEKSDNKQTEYKRNTNIAAPLFFWGHNIKSSQVYRKIKATEIAPSVSYLLRIKKPNACKDNVLEELDN
jgi:hypothetical protein